MSAVETFSDPTALPDEPVSSPFRKSALALVALTLLLQLAMVWSVKYPPLLDYSNHIARHYLEYRYFTGQEVPEFYTIRYAIRPNLGGDLVIPPLMMVFSPGVAGKVFLSASLILYWAGATVFFGELHGWRLPGILAALLYLPLVLSYHFILGNINYYTGIGLAFLTLAHFLWLRRQTRPRPLGWLLQTGLVALLFLCHLAAWGTWGVVAAAYSIHDMLVALRQGQTFASVVKRQALTIAALVPSIALLCIYVSGITDGAEESKISYGPIMDHMRMPLSLFRGYLLWTDAVGNLLWLAALASFFTLSKLTRVFHHWTFYAASALVLLYLIVPFRIGSMEDAYSRVLPPLLVMSLAAISSLPARASRVAVFLLMVCCGLRYGAAIYRWHAIDERLTQHARAFELLEPGSRVFSLTPGLYTREMPDHFFICWAVIERERIFAANLYSKPNQQPLEFTPPLKHINCNDPNYDLQRVMGQFDYFWIYNPDNYKLKIPAEAKKVYDQRALSVWRIPHPPAF